MTMRGTAESSLPARYDRPPRTNGLSAGDDHIQKQHIS